MVGETTVKVRCSTKGVVNLASTGRWPFARGFGRGVSAQPPGAAVFGQGRWKL